MGEAAQQQRTLTGLRVHPDDGMLGFVDLGDEGQHVREPFLADAGSQLQQVGPGVVVTVRVDRP